MDGERSFVLRSLAIVVGVLAVLAVGDWVHATLTSGPSHLDLTRACLGDDRGYYLFAVTDPVALTAKKGALMALIEGNRVSISIAGSSGAAEKLAAAYGQVPSPQLEVRGDRVYRWDRPPSPTQRQAVYDCER